MLQSNFKICYGVSRSLCFWKFIVVWQKESSFQRVKSNYIAKIRECQEVFWFKLKWTWHFYYSINWTPSDQIYLWVSNILLLFFTLEASFFLHFIFLFKKANLFNIWFESKITMLILTSVTKYFYFLPKALALRCNTQVVASNRNNFEQDNYKTVS